MGFRDDFRGTGKTYVERSLDHIEIGLNANSEKLRTLRDAVKSSFDQVITRDEALAESLREEVAYQSEQMYQAVERGSQEIAEAIQQLSDYLGAGLAEVRWSVELHRRVSENMLHVLLSSLSNESRQYWEQGVACYEAREYELAKERFQKALEANRTNSFVYQYLGFIAVAEDDESNAIRNFDLASKFSQDQYHRALALSHLARSYAASGRLPMAVDSSKAAVDANPAMPKFWYEYSLYCCDSGNTVATVCALREAIERDWGYWSVTVTERTFDKMRTAIGTLLDDLRSREREKAARSLDRIRRAIDQSQALGATSERLGTCRATLRDLEDGFTRDNVNVYREIQSEAPNAARQALDSALASIAEKRKELACAITLLHQELGERRTVPFVFCGFLCALVAAMFGALVISGMHGWAPKSVGPMRVFTPTTAMLVRATGETVAAGSSKKIVNENAQTVTIRFSNGDTALPRSELVKFGRLETGYIQDYTNTISATGEVIWLFCAPIGIWVFASTYMRVKSLNPVFARVRELETTILDLDRLEDRAKEEISQCARKAETLHKGA